jgi:hypothetical protein
MRARRRDGQHDAADAGMRCVPARRAVCLAHLVVWEAQPDVVGGAQPGGTDALVGLHHLLKRLGGLRI